MLLGRPNSYSAHIGGMDAFARALVIADRLNRDPRFTELKSGRYRSSAAAEGQRFETGDLGLNDLRNYAASHPEPELESGRQELLENLINDHMVG